MVQTIQAKNNLRDLITNFELSWSGMINFPRGRMIYQS